MDSLGDAVAAEDVADKELGRGAERLYKLLAILLILVQDGHVAAVGANLLTAGLAQSGRAG